jgi:hypothetical protein
MIGYSKISQRMTDLKKNIKKEVSKVHCLKGKGLKAHSEESSVKDSKTLFKIDKTQSHAI